MPYDDFCVNRPIVLSNNLVDIIISEFRFTAASIQMTVVWDVAPCSLEIDWRFRGAYCLLIPLMMEAVITSEKSVTFYETTLHNIPESSHFHNCHHENLKHHKT
jgi:hypothetical protein